MSNVHVKGGAARRPSQRGQALRLTPRRLVAGLAVVLLGAFVQTVRVEARAPKVPVAASTLGMRPFAGSFDATRFAAAEAWLGRPISWTVLMASRVSPSQMNSSVWGEMERKNAPLPKLAHRLDVVMTVPLTFGTGSARDAAGRAAIRAKLLETASGQWDNDFRNIARSLAAGGYGDAVIRLGHEMTGPFYPWSSQGNEDAYIAAYRHIHGVMRSASPQLRFEWNAARNTFVTYGPGAYPGDDVVDVIGIDTYYDPPKGDPVPFDADVWARRYVSILTPHLNFAKQHGKPVSYAEWAVGGVDEPAYVQAMGNWFSSLPASGPGSLLYQSYFAVPRAAYDLSVRPRTAAALRSVFGAPSPTTTVPVPSATSTTAPQPTTTTTTPQSTTTTTTGLPTSTTTVPVSTTLVPSASLNVFDQRITHRADQLVEVPLGSPLDWGAGANLRNGTFRVDFAVLSNVLAQPAEGQICFWQNGRAEQVCAPRVLLGDAAVTADLGSPSLWWASPGWRWDLPAESIRVLFKDPASGNLLNSQRCGTVCYAGATLPGGDLITARVTVSAAPAAV